MFVNRNDTQKVVAISPIVSKCCRSPVVIKPDDHFFHAEQEVQITLWYECIKCGKPCDVEQVEEK